jgi:catechol 2,3-dioxygenase-like lactoylglutathione lyase family enzyme
MKPRITFVTLGVDDLERSLAFYRDGLGLSTQGIIGQELEYGAVAFFELTATPSERRRRESGAPAPRPLAAPATSNPRVLPGSLSCRVTAPSPPSNYFREGVRIDEDWFF